MCKIKYNIIEYNFNLWNKYFYISRSQGWKGTICRIWFDCLNVFHVFFILVISNVPGPNRPRIGPRNLMQLILPTDKQTACSYNWQLNSVLRWPWIDPFLGSVFLDHFWQVISSYVPFSILWSNWIFKCGLFRSLIHLLE